jgi:hypothetical protein
MTTPSIANTTSSDNAASPVTADPPANTAPARNPFSLERYSTGVRKTASFGLALLIGGLFVAILWAPSYWPLSVLCASACMALGWAVGFLFGVPRSSSTNASARINTNLEQISDWLTKILVGVGLTQLQQIPGALRELAGYISKDFGKSGSDVFSLSMVLYFFTIGFLMGYLLTRLALQREFDDAENIQVNTTGPAEIKVTQPAPDKAAPDKAAPDKAAADKAADDKAAEKI